MARKEVIEIVLRGGGGGEHGSSNISTAPAHFSLSELILDGLRFAFAAGSLDGSYFAYPLVRVVEQRSLLVF